MTTNYIYKWGKETPKATAVVSGALNLSYLELACLIAKLVKVFENCGVTKGKLIGLNFQDGSYHRVLELVMIYALEAIGAIRVSDLSESEIIDRCDLIFTDSPLLASSELNKEPSVIAITKEWISNSFNIQITTKDLERLNSKSYPRDIVFIGSSSGTTGKKKYFNNDINLIKYWQNFVSRVYFFNSIKDCLTIYPIHIGASYVGIKNTLEKGGTVFLTSLENLFWDIAAHSKSHSALLMKDVNYLIKYSEIHKKHIKLANFRVFGSHLPINIRTWLQTHLAEKVVNSYSSTESGQIGEALPNGQCQIYPEVQLRIVDEGWHDLPQGELGQVTIKSPMQISGYLWNPELNAQHFKDGWFRSNDIGYLTPEGNLVLVDRADNMLNLAGIKVPPAPIEAQIKLLPGVDDCVLLEEDTLSDLQTIAICIETSKILDTNLFEKEVRVVLAGRFKSYRFCYLEAFPRTDTGKVKRKELQQQLLGVIDRTNDQ